MGAAGLRFPEAVSLEISNGKTVGTRSYPRSYPCFQGDQEQVQSNKGKSTIAAILGAKLGRRKSNLDKSPDYSDEELTNIDDVKIMSIINSPDVSRVLLERLASKRFGVTKGALSMLGSRHALKDKLLTLLGHEGTHEAIARAVGGSHVTDVKKPNNN